MRILLLTTTFLAVLFVTGLAHGQSSPDSVAYKTNLNYNILPFLSDPGSANFGLLLRLQKPDNRALRLGANFLLSTGSSEASPNAPTESFFQSSGLSLGYEWQKPIHKLTFYYGPEISGGYRSSHSVYTNSQTIDPYVLKTDAKSRSFSAGASGFLGVRWNVITQLSISVESSFGYTFNYSKTDSKTYYVANMATNYENKGRDHNIRFIPVRAIYIGYHF